MRIAATKNSEQTTACMHVDLDYKVSSGDIEEGITWLPPSAKDSASLTRSCKALVEEEDPQLRFSERHLPMVNADLGSDLGLRTALSGTCAHYNCKVAMTCCCTVTTKNANTRTTGKWKVLRLCPCGLIECQWFLTLCIWKCVLGKNF